MGGPTVFISYSHKDERWKNRLVTHLGVLAKQDLIKLWDDRCINAGQDWYQEIQNAMEVARVAILLVSANSLTSDFILREEVQRLLERREEEGLLIFPVIVEPCDWEAVPWLCRMQLHPIDGRPLSSCRKHQIDADLTAIAKEVRSFLNSSIHPSRPQESLPKDPVVSSTGSNVMVDTQTAPIEITINRDFELYTEDEQSKLLSAIAKFLAITGDVRVIRKRPGSVKLTFEFTVEQAERLLWAVKRGEFTEYGVVDAELIKPGSSDIKSTPLSQPVSEKSDKWDIAPPPLIAKGQDLFGKYRLLEKIGEGGMGEVWLVDNLHLDRKSALKLIKPEIAHNDKGWRRFQREARLMAKLEHPNAVVVYDFQRTHSMGYIEMEFVRGRSLDKYLKEHEGEQLPLEWIAALLDQLCAVLQEAHGHLDEKSGKPKPIIHRDLKPSNLMLMDRKPQGQNLKVLDFGIAKMIEEDRGPEVTLTAAGDLLGTPAFMSPEQIRGGWGKDAEHEVDNRSDLYSVGVLLYQLLTGKTPFRRRDPFALLAAHLSEPPPPMKEMNPKTEVPAAVERLVMQCLDKDPTKRPQNAQELSRMFRAAAGLSPKPLQPRRSLWLAVGAACVGIGLLVVLAHSWWPSPSPVDGLRPKPSAPVVPATPWLPDGYKRIESSPLAKGSDEYLGIVRKADSVVFHRIGPGIYLPEGYEPATEDWDPNSGAWPPAIVRKPESVRFILIPGGTYRRGDPDGQARDFNGQPITPHWVRVRSFYIQETEVTNAEVEDYVDRHAGDAAPFQKWRDFYTEQKRKIKPVERAQRFPAACVSYLAARTFSRERGGRLPTEAEWEFAAKSRDSNRAYPWGNAPPVLRNVAKANINNPFNNTGLAAATVVRDFPSDRTEQGIYDMAGNVSELCLDRYEPYGELDLAKNNEKEPLEDPGLQLASRANAPAATFVVRGGSFLSRASEATTFYRGMSVPPDESPTDVGFRVVVECPGERERGHH